MPKGSKAKATKMNLAEFTGNTEPTNDLAWAEDNWGEEEQAGQNDAGEKKAFYGFKVGSMGDFRNEEAAALDTVVPVDMEPPFTAHIGNLPNGMNEEQLQSTFTDSELNVVQVHLVHRGKTTFGYVEFSTRDELQACILQSGRNVMGRRIRCDIATEQQRARLMKGNQEQVSLSRDGMAQEQPEFNGMGGRGRGMRSSGSMGDFGRDAFGSSEQQQQGGFAGLGSGGASIDDLGDFRSAGPVAQPNPPTGGWGEGRRDRGSRGNSKPASPNSNEAPREFGGWRDAPKAEQPNWRDAPKAEQAEAPKKESGSWRRSSDSGSSPTTEQPPAPAPQVKTFKANKVVEGVSWRDRAAVELPPKKEEEPKKKEYNQVKPKAAKPTQAPVPTEGNRFAGLGRK